MVLVPFPFDDFSGTKVRPAVCLTNPVGKYEHIIIAFISSKMSVEKISTDITIQQSDLGFEATGLLVNSVIRVHKLVTIPKNLICRELGFADNNLSHQITNCIKKLFEV